MHWLTFFRAGEQQRQKLEEESKYNVLFGTLLALKHFP